VTVDLATCPICHQLYPPNDTPLRGRCARCIPRPVRERWSAERMLTATLQGIVDRMATLPPVPPADRHRSARPARAATKELFQARVQILRSPGDYADVLAEKLGFPDATTLCAYPEAPLLLWDAFWGPDGQRTHRLRGYQEPWRIFWGSDFLYREPYCAMPPRLSRPITTPVRGRHFADDHDIATFRRYRIRYTRWLRQAYHEIPAIWANLPPQA
jgi:hypothetical protein